MVDITQFLTKHAKQARAQGISTGVYGAVHEAATWGVSQAAVQLYGQGDYIWDDPEWDICLVADATRWDQWQQISPEYDWLHDESGWSVGSASPEWYGQTFDPDSLADVDTERVGVVTANPFAGKHRRRMPDLLGDATPIDRHDFAVVDYVFDDSWGCEIEAGEHLDVVHPATVTDRAYRAWSEHDLDRLVVHYMQPHLPFRARPEWFGRRQNLKHFGEDNGEQPCAGPGKSIWKRLRDGQVPREEVWAAYCDNLRWVLDDINRLRTSVDAELLITSDHGNALGEWGLWSHPPRMYTPELRRVPWVKVTAEATEEFRPRDIESINDRTIDEQLEALGYVTD